MKKTVWPPNHNKNNRDWYESTHYGAQHNIELVQLSQIFESKIDITFTLVSY